MLLPILFWGAAVFFPEFLEKETGVGISHMVADVVDSHTGVAQKPGGLLQPLSLNHFLEGGAGVLPDIGGQIVGVHVEKFCGGFQRAALIVVFNIADNGENRIVSGLR